MALDLATIDKKFLSARPPKEGKNILTPICRISFPNLFTARSADPKNPDSKKRFGVSLLIPPQCDISLLKKAAGECATAKWGDKAAELKKKTPFLDAGEYKYEGYIKGWTLIRATCMSKPTVVQQEQMGLVKVTEDDSDIVYPGRWCTASVNAFAYDTNGNKGVSFGLNNIMLLNHDDSLGGRMKAEDEFESVGDYETADGSGKQVKSIEDMF